MTTTDAPAANQATDSQNVGDVAEAARLAVLQAVTASAPRADPSGLKHLAEALSWVTQSNS